ncbi:MAG: GGDEF domain-containing protein [Elusimicrobia bacterium]|nr:GGDEF domain-containing protein [Elusimicrobiota bacterium]
MEWLKVSRNKKTAIGFVVLWSILMMLLPERYALCWMFVMPLAVFYFCLRYSDILPVMTGIGMLLPFLKTRELFVVFNYDIYLLLSMYFGAIYFRSYEDIEKKNEPVLKHLRKKVEGLTGVRDTIRKSHTKMKVNLEKIRDMYLVSKEIVEHMDMYDMLEYFTMALLKKSDKIKQVVYFNKKGETGIDEDAMFCSEESSKPDWVEFLGGRSDLLRSKDVVKLGGSIFWPVYLEQNLGYFIFQVEVGKEQECVDEISPFFSQLTLALRRSDLYEEVERRSRKDGLTDLFLRRYFIERFDEEILRAKRYGNRFAVFMIDIDHFKNVNDTYGHPAGDFVLREISKIFTENIRKGDLIARYGGEEFIIYLPHCEIEESMNIAEKIRKGVRSHVFDYGGTKIELAVSIGITLYPADADYKEALISAADSALYMAKREGRDQSRMYKEFLETQ